MIKQGYMVKIESYGGDMDWYNTYLKDGLTFEDAKWIYHFFDAYYAKCHHEHKVTTETILEVIRATVSKLGYLWSNFSDNDPDEDTASDMAYELLGAPCEYSGYWNKVAKIEVHFIPVDVAECSNTLWF